MARLEPGRTIGQTFVSRRPGLNSVQLWLRQITPPKDPQAAVLLELYHSPLDSQPVALVSVRFASLARYFPITFSFPAQRDPPGQKYYLVLKADDGIADLYGRSEDAYPYGDLYINGEPQPADAGFRTSYEYGLAAMLPDLATTVANAWLVIPLLLVLWAPGRLLLWRFLQRPGMDWGQRTALSVGMSLALFPVVMLWTGAMGLRWNRTAAWIASAAILAALLWLYLRNLLTSGLRTVHGWRLPDGLDVALMAVFAFTLALRLIMARDLAAPPWVDPVHHTTIARLIYDTGRYPDSYAPYVATQTASYHPGFHATAAAFTWLSGMNLADAMLLFGQVQNALAVLAVYLLAVTLTRNRTAGVLAALATGAFFPMPAYYLSWGRYTELAGLLILPACITLIQALTGRPAAHRFYTVFVAALACAGMFMTHYRVAVFLAAWLAAYLIAEVIRNLDRRAIWDSLVWLAGHFTGVGILAILLTLPWWPSLFHTLLGPAIEASGSKLPESLTIDWAYLTPAYGKPILWLAAAGLLLSVLRLDWFGLTLLLWVGLLFMSANQGSIHIPLAGNVNKNSVEISLFLPAAVLAGYGVAVLLRWLKSVFPRVLQPLFRVVVVAILVYWAIGGGERVLTLLNPATVLLRQADRPALEWVSANLPADTTVLINPFLWGYGIYAGQDGGYWITPLAGRKTMPPPALYGLGASKQFGEITRLNQAVLKEGKDPQALYNLMQAEGIHYIYTGSRGGTLSPKALSESPLFKVLYNQDGVWVFEIK